MAVDQGDCQVITVCRIPSSRGVHIPHFLRIHEEEGNGLAQNRNAAGPSSCSVVPTHADHTGL